MRDSKDNPLWYDYVEDADSVHTAPRKPALGTYNFLRIARFFFGGILSSSLLEKLRPKTS